MIRSKISLLIMLCIATFSRAFLITSDSIESIDCYCQQKNSMLFLDLDETIGLRVFDPKLTHYLGNKLLFNPFDLGFFDRLHYVQKLKPMEPRTMPLLHKLQAQHIPLVVVTARPIEIEDHTKRQLDDIGLDVSKNNRIKNQTITDNAIYKDGVIYCSSQEKGPILLKFLRDNNLNPDTVVFADNRLDHAQSVDQTLTAAGINCVSLYYTQEKLLPYMSSFSELF